MAVALDFCEVERLGTKKQKAEVIVRTKLDATSRSALRC